jgi:hypothetical protein
VYDVPLVPIDVVQTLTRESQSVTLEFAWPHVAIDPHRVNWIGAKCEVSAAFESGDSMEPYELRDVLLVGSVTVADIDAVDTRMQLTIESSATLDTGSTYATDAELSPLRFYDTGLNTDLDARNRAYHAMRLLPPIPFCRDGGALESPLIVVQDETPANGTDAIVPRRFLVSYVPIASEDSPRDVMFLRPDRTDEYYRPQTQLQAAIQVDTDDIGDQYRYIDSPLYFVVGGSANTEFFNGLDIVTMSKKQGMVHEGDAIKASGDTDAHYGTIESIDGAAVTLESAYTGTSGASAAHVLKLPIDSQYPAFICLGSSGGGACVNGAPVSSVAGVTAYLLGYSRIDGVILLPEVRALHTETLALDVEFCVNKRQAPLSLLDETLLQWSPFQLYQDGAYLRAISTVQWHDLTHPALTVSDGAVGAECYRNGAYTRVGQFSPPRTLRYAWSARLERTMRSLSFSGTLGGSVRTRRMNQIDAQRQAQRVTQDAASDAIETHEIAEIADRDVAGVASVMQLMRDGAPVWQVSLDVAPCLRWMRPGDTVTLDDSQVPSVADGATVWRVVRVERGMRDVVVCQEWRV